MPAVPGLRMRQTAFVARTLTSELASTRQITSGRTPQAIRLRGLLGLQANGGEGSATSRFERISAPRGLTFPSLIIIPSSQEKEERNRRAVEGAMAWSQAPGVFWTDGSASPSGRCAAAVAYFEHPAVGGAEDPARRVVVRRRAAPRPGCERRRHRRTYGEEYRFVRKKSCEEGWRVESWGKGRRPGSSPGASRA